MDQSDIQAARSRAANIAAAVLARRVSALIGAVDLIRLRPLLDVPDDDPEFETLMLIDSECDELPIGPVRQYWSEEALARKAPEVLDAEQWALETGRDAFQNIVERFAAADKPLQPVVLGLEMAAAVAAERDRLSRSELGPSPLSGKSYDAERGEFNLATFDHAPLDAEIAGLVETWFASGESQRNQLRSTLSLGDNYTLIHFSRRMAVRALSEVSTESYALGLVALAMIDEVRIDPRDASAAAGLLNHAASRQHVDPTDVFNRAAALATAGMAGLLRRATGTTLDDWGYREWRTPSRIGLIRSGWSRYEPTIDLVSLACTIASSVLNERYVVDDPEVAVKLPSVWFSKGSREHAATLLKGALGVVSAQGSLRRAAGAATSQMVIVWIAEMPSPTDGVELVADVGDGETHDGRFVAGVSVGRLFALVVAGSFQQGIEPFESAATVNELRSRIRTCLAGSSGGAA